MKDFSRQPKGDAASRQPAANADAANALQRRAKEDQAYANGPRLTAQRQAIDRLGRAEPAQRAAADEEEEPLLQAKRDPVQRMEGDEEEELPLQGRFANSPLQRQANAPEEVNGPLQAQADEPRGGLPTQLRTGIEALSGMDLSDVRVHRNSSQPAQLNALAYAQGNDIHLGPGQEQHLSHEAWHVVQQRQGRVRETVQMAGVGVNDEVGLESEADVMGARAAVQGLGLEPHASKPNLSNRPDETLMAQQSSQSHQADIEPVQRMVGVAKSNIGTDLIETNSIKYALDRAGGPVDTLHKLDISKVPDGGSIYIVAHGNKITSGDYTAPQILAFLLNKANGLRADATNVSIVFTSCRAGEGLTDSAVDSVSGEVAKGLRDAGRRNIAVSGARGLSLKSNATGDDFTVIDPTKDAEYWPIQFAMLSKHKPKERYTNWLLQNPNADFEERANAASDISRDFYIELIAQVEYKGLNLPNQEAMSHHKIDDKGNFYFKLKNMGRSPFPLDIEDYGGPWRKLK